jgi:glycosidase
MEGERDPDCRRPFVWDWEKDPRRSDVRAHYKKMTGLRHAHPALRTGDFRTVLADGKLFAYLRSDAKETFLVVLNAGTAPAEATLDLSSVGKSIKATDLLAGGHSTWGPEAKVSVPAEGYKVYQLK